MLVLSRKENERIRLGPSIVVTVVRVHGDKVRLGIEAPPNVLVLRDELEEFGGAAGEGPAPSHHTTGHPTTGREADGVPAASRRAG